MMRNRRNVMNGFHTPVRLFVLSVLFIACGATVPPNTTHILHGASSSISGMNTFTNNRVLFGISTGYNDDMAEDLWYQLKPALQFNQHVYRFKSLSFDLHYAVSCAELPWFCPSTSLVSPASNAYLTVFHNISMDLGKDRIRYLPGMTAAFMGSNGTVWGLDTFGSVAKMGKYRFFGGGSYYDHQFIDMSIFLQFPLDDGPAPSAFGKLSVGTDLPDCSSVIARISLGRFNYSTFTNRRQRKTRSKE